MGGLSIWHILIFGGFVLLLFGSRFKISDVMGDLGKGITSFRKGLASPDDPSTPPPEPAPKKDTSANP